MLIIGLGVTTFKYSDQLSGLKLVEKEQLQSKAPVVIDFYRYHIYTCIYNKISEHPTLGMGMADVQPYLSECLPQDEWPGLTEFRREFNAHSQFLNYLISGGIIGLILFIGMWAKLFSLALNQKQKILLLILIIALVNSFFENFLSRIWGAFFFTFFTFVFANLKFPQTINKKGD